jgi:hypothetical protein
MKALVIDRHSSLFLLQHTQAVFKPSQIFASKAEAPHLSMHQPNGTVHFKNWKQLFEYQHLILHRHLVVKVLIYI